MAEHGLRVLGVGRGAGRPATARAIARQVGLSDRPDVITGAGLETLDDAALHDQLRHVNLFERFKPQHKLRLVQRLRASGEVVAMTGGGVNDAPPSRSPTCALP